MKEKMLLYEIANDGVYWLMLTETHKKSVLCAQGSFVMPPISKQQM